MHSREITLPHQCVISQIGTRYRVGREGPPLIGPYRAFVCSPEEIVIAQFAGDILETCEWLHAQGLPLWEAYAILTDLDDDLDPKENP